jgi:pyruvate/2-oxoacid:ferredoxin oxidoreductase alpha subunit
MAGGAYTNGSSWVDASSREYKEKIEVLSTEEALEAIKELNPVKYAYKTDQTEKRVGFIAEEVPELVSMKDRKGLSPMDIVAVLTKVVQEQQKTISILSEELDKLKEKVR